MAKGRAVARYPSYTTMVVGSHSVPRWYEALGRGLADGSLSVADVADARLRATQAAILDQERAGIDLVTGGEMDRRISNRHAPFNAMLNHFWSRLPGFSKTTRPRAITLQDPNVLHPAAVCTGPIGDADLGLVAEFELVSRFARRPVKITMTGPHALAKVAHDEHYGSLGLMMQDLAKVLRRNFCALAAAGCRHLQIDEPLLASADDDEVRAAVEAVNLATEGLGKGLGRGLGKGLGEGLAIQVHVCQGNYAVGVDYDGQLGHRYFTGARYPAALICGLRCDVLLIEHDMAGHYQGHLGNRQLALGAVDVQDLEVETGEQVAERVRRHRWLAPEQTLITSSCGLNHLPRQLAFAKLQAMSAAQALLRSGVS